MRVQEQSSLMIFDFMYNVLQQGLTYSTAPVVVVEALLHFHLVLCANVLDHAQNVCRRWHSSKTELLSIQNMNINKSSCHTELLT